MEDLKSMLDKGMPIVDINNNVNQFVDSADGYPDKLKLTCVLLNLIQSGLNCLRSVDFDDFTLQIKERIDEVENQSKELCEVYGTHLLQDEAIVDVLINGKDPQGADIQQQIQKLLSEYDAVIKKLVKQRESLLMSDLLNKSNSNTKNI